MKPKKVLKFLNKYLISISRGRNTTEGNVTGMFNTEHGSLMAMTGSDIEDVVKTILERFPDEYPTWSGLTAEDCPDIPYK